MKSKIELYDGLICENCGKHEEQADFLEIKYSEEYDQVLCEECLEDFLFADECEKDKWNYYYSTRGV